MIKRKHVIYLTQAAMIASMYAVLTIAQNLLIPGSASTAVQFRAAEALTVLAVYTPAAIPGLTLGCVIANISSVTAGLGFYDMIFGSTASLFAAVAMYLLRNARVKNIPVPALLMPALFNGLIIGFEIDFFFIGSMHFNTVDFLLQSGLVAVGELAVLLVLGTPLCVLLNKKGVQMGVVIKD